MKKILFSFVTMLFIVAGFSSCSSDANDLSSRTEEEQFYHDLELLREKQLSLINTATRSTAEVNKEEMTNVLMSIEDESRKFIVEHKETLKEYMPAEVVSIDQYELMSYDEELMNDYLNNNFSKSFVESYLSIMERGTYSACRLTPLESLLITNASAYQTAMQTYVQKDLEIELEDGKLHPTVQKKQCKENLNRQIHYCNLAQGFVAVIGGGITLAATIFSEGGAIPAVTAVDSYFSALAFGIWASCVESAKKDYRKCLNK